jgi:3-deoxy-7-phosphoheptulonate synthase
MLDFHNLFKNKNSVNVIRMDKNIVSLKEIPSPNELLEKYSITEENKQFILNSRNTIQDILNNTDKRLIVIIGPCSIHDYDTAIEYASHIKTFQKLYPNLFIVMRVYFEKPRSRHGWKGFIYDPDLNDTFDINKGLDLARKLCQRLTQLEIPIGCEYLDTITPQYLSDLISWGAIGARTSESQIHRQLASGLSSPIGFKNLTDGDYKKAIDGLLSARYPHQFLGINYNGHACHVSTKGNEHTHLILRGGLEPNYYQENIDEITETLVKENIKTGIIIDCSHGNSQKEYIKQIYVANSIKRLLTLNKNSIIKGVMIESHINSGNQKLTNTLKTGVSITDGCINIESSLHVLNILNSNESKQLTDLQSIREYLHLFEAPILNLYDAKKTYISDLLITNLNTTDTIVNYDDDLFKIMSTNSELMCLLHRRLSISEMIADIKFNMSPMNYLNKMNDFYKLVTDRDVERKILNRVITYSNLNKEKNKDLFIKIMELSKRIQVKYLEKNITTKKIGYLGSTATFSYEVIHNNFYGVHKGYSTIDDIYTKLNNHEIDFGLIPTYNSLIGVVYSIDQKYKSIGTIDHKIILSVFTNNININYDTVETLYIQEIVYKEVIQYTNKKLRSNITIVYCKTTEEGCLKCIQDNTSMTIASTNNKCNFLHLLEDNIVDHNITTFSLIKMESL